MLIREATPADLPAITAIYAHHVLHGAGTFEEVPPDEADMAARMKKVLAGPGNAWLVAEDEAGETEESEGAYEADEAGNDGDGDKGGEGTLLNKKE